MKRLQDRVAIVTGAAKGIGRGIAERLSAEGAVVVVADLDDTKGREMAETLSAGGSRAAFQHVDVSDPASVTEMVRTAIERFGRLDIQVSNAGITNRAAFLDYPLDDWNQVLRVNLTGCFLCGQAAARPMKDKGGRIVNISSVSGQAGGMGRAAYGASKAGIINLTQTMAMELAPPRHHRQRDRAGADAGRAHGARSGAARSLHAQDGDQALRQALRHRGRGSVPRLRRRRFRHRPRAQRRWRLPRRRRAVRGG